MTDKLTLIVDKIGLQPAQSKTLLDNFGDYFVKAHKLKAKAENIKVTSIEQVDEMQEARELRLELKDLRVDADKTRIALKADYLKGANAVQGIYNDIKKIVKPAEDFLLEQEKFAERLQAEKDSKIEDQRFAKMSEFTGNALQSLHPKDLSQESFEKLFETYKFAHEARIKAEEEAEKERIEKIEADKKERARIEKENEKLKKEAEARDKAEAKTKAEQAEVLRIEREKTEKAENELIKKRDDDKLAQAKKMMEDKAKADAQEREDKKKLLAPDKEKLVELAASMVMVDFPYLKTKQANEIKEEARELMFKAHQVVIEGIKKL